jgi:hypothetical protein
MRHCQVMDAPQIGEGWQRRVCSNSDYDSWISPSGEECFGNPASGNTRCEGQEMYNKPILPSFFYSQFTMIKCIR